MQDGEQEQGEAEAEPSGWQKIVHEPIEKKGGYTGADLADETAPTGAPAVTPPPPRPKEGTEEEKR